MTLRLTTICFDANDPVRLARFWAGVLNWETHDEAGEVVLRPTDGTRFYIEFAPVPEPKEGKNRIHVDLSSTSSEAQNAPPGVVISRSSHVTVSSARSRKRDFPECTKASARSSSNCALS